MIEYYNVSEDNHNLSNSALKQLKSYRALLLVQQ
jgi:hypothetical protein